MPSLSDGVAIAGAERDAVDGPAIGAGKRAQAWPATADITVMNAIASIALSGMQFAQQRLQVSAHNVANIATEGFAPQRVVGSARAGGGVDSALQTAAAGGTNLVEEIVEQVTASYAFRANVVSLQRADRLLGTLLDVHA